MWPGPARGRRPPPDTAALLPGAEKAPLPGAKSGYWLLSRSCHFSSGAQGEAPSLPDPQGLVHGSWSVGPEPPAGFLGRGRWGSGAPAGPARDQGTGLEGTAEAEPGRRGAPSKAKASQELGAAPIPADGCEGRRGTLGPWAGLVLSQVGLQGHPGPHGDPGPDPLPARSPTGSSLHLGMDTSASCPTSAVADTGAK